MKKRILVIILILSSLFFAYKKILKFFTNDEIDENVFSIVKSKNIILENWLICTGILLILISVIGIIITLKPIKFKFKNKNQKINLQEQNQDFENLYS
ncbi:MAG: hypothetical protein J6P21_04160 [Clostridia bacterium]|nr:hypothetical protein [Clostridia bacterium]